MFWRVILALGQGLNRQYKTWDFQLSHSSQHSWLFLGHSLPTLSRGMHGFCRDLPQVCCLGDVKIPTAACLSALRSFKSSYVRLHGFVVSLPFLSPKETPEIFLQMLSHGSGHEELSVVWRRLGLCWFS